MVAASFVAGLILQARPSQQAIEVSSDSLQIAILRTQLETTQALQSDLLTTVHWTLGIVASMAALLIGYSWFTNHRVYEREQTALRQEVHAQMERSASDHRQELVDLLSTKFEGLEEKALARVESATSSALDALHIRIRQLESQVGSLRLADKLQDARYWELRATPGNEIDRYREFLGIAIELGKANAVHEALKNIIRLLKAGAPMYSGHVSSLSAQLDELPGNHDVEVETIRTLLKEGSGIY